MECRLSRSDTPWSCTVELRFITDKKGQPLGQARNEPFGEPIFDKSEVEDRIRRAQRAILNPSKPSRSFLDDIEDDATEISFSTNYISLQISGPEVADHRPEGLIASVSRGGNERDIAMVENLVASYISKPSCVILLTVACETDFENQRAHHLTKTYDPEGKRTIGVLTKPDRIPCGDEENWLPLIRNEQEPLENNWYCVKQPSSQDLKQGITWEEAQSRENDFFSLTPPWSELDPVYQKYLRTSNLIDRLSSILSDLISKRLPQIQIELENTVQKTRASLAQLPKSPSSEPVGEIAALLHDFVDELHKILEGVPRADGLLQIIRPAQEQFRRAIRSTAPDFRPFEAPEEGSGVGAFPDPTFLLNEDGVTDYSDGRNPIFIDQVLDSALALTGLWG
ncbi:P-loop containing nucleoside triphosphate hydrolase protein [Mycena capillaripes]|nr:P-loop containing nucleoside triphosphate hydrolase protein [Mycena capillaripes]